jgi:hypothetical protein
MILPRAWRAGRSPANDATAVESKGPPMPDVPRMTLRSPLRAVAWTLLTLAASAAATARADGEASQTQASEIEASQPQPTRTAKERLGGKASDEQRLDNCKVPRDLRGPKPRPDDCGDAASPPPQR